MEEEPVDTDVAVETFAKTRTRKRREALTPVESTHVEEPEPMPQSRMSPRLKPLQCKICKGDIVHARERRNGCNNPDCHEPSLLHFACLEENLAQHRRVTIECTGCELNTTFEKGFSWRDLWLAAMITLGLIVLSYLPYFLVFYFAIPYMFEAQLRFSHIAFSWGLLGLIYVGVVITRAYCSLMCRCLAFPLRPCLCCFRRCRGERISTRKRT